MTRGVRWIPGALIAVPLMSVAVIAVILRPSAVPPAEVAAIAYVEQNGFCTGGQSLPAFSALFARATGQPAVVRPRTVGFPRNRLDDDMVEHLMSIRDLGAVMLFPPDIAGRGYDTDATSVSTLDAFSDIEVAASSESLTRLQQQHPGLLILVANRPSDGVAPEAVPASSL